MHDDDQPQDAAHTSRVHLADLLSERRIAVASDVVGRLRLRDVAGVSPLIVRSLVDALVSSLSEGSPDGVVQSGPVVCACFGVGLTTIHTAMSTGARSVEAIGAAIKAGTNCGSCVPELRRLVAATEAASVR